MAGGFTSDANNLKVNMSAVLKDQDVIIVPSIFDIEVEIPIDNPVTNPSDVLLDINRANLEQLQTLPGIGPSTAQKIIDYRTTSGYFDVIEDSIFNGIQEFGL